MTAYIDDIIIQGTPEEIQEFIELRDRNCVTGNYKGWFEGSQDTKNVDLESIVTPANAYFANDNIEFKT